jgi:hypothetical protein
MNDPDVAFWLVVAILILLAVAVVGFFMAAIVLHYFLSRRDEARKVTRSVPGLGDFSTCDDKLWFGDVEGLHFSIVGAGEPPADPPWQLVRSILDQRPALIERARTYLIAHEDTSLLPGGPEAFEPYGIDIEDASCFFLELIHPADIDGVYRVEFRDGEPVGSGRDD